MQIETEIEIVLKECERKFNDQQFAKSDWSRLHGEAIVRRRAEIVALLELAGVDASAITWASHDMVSGNQLLFDIRILDVKITCRTAARLTWRDVAKRWDWVNPVTDQIQYRSANYSVYASTAEQAKLAIINCVKAEKIVANGWN